MTVRVLVVEDEPDIGKPLAENLSLEGYDVRLASDGGTGLALMQSWQPALVILDLMLPDVRGETVLRQARESGLVMPVLILSARSGELEKVRGFRLGADDYVTKPFGLLEVLARVGALLRRVQPGGKARPPVIRLGEDVEIQLSSRRVLRGGEEVMLRPKEVDLLFALIERAGDVVTRPHLLREVWGYAPGVGSRTVDWHIAELRRKLGDDARDSRLIETIKKVGYRVPLFEPSTDDEN